MPNQILTGVLGCFGLECLVGENLDRDRDRDRAPVQANPPRARPALTAAPAPAPAPATAPAVPHGYAPGRHYSLAELDQFATHNRPSAANRSAFLADLVSTMLLPNTGKSNKIMICKHLVNLMTEEDGLMCHGAVRQRNYFASYCVDLALQQLAQQFSANLEETLRSMLTLWVNTLSPVQDEFNINGVIYTRAELLKMLEAPVLIGREWRQPRSHLADQLERALKGRGNTSNAQTVHDHGVQSNAGRVLNIMRAKHGRTDQISDQEVVAMIEKVSRHRKNKDDILSGMHACLQNSRRDNNWNVDLTPQQAIKEVVQYILSVKDPTMRLNLTQALLHRLEEIQLETPCVSGKLQRLLDVPNGIDPDMDFAGADRQIAEDMATLAGKTYEQFNKLIDEGIEAIQEEEKNPDTTQSIAKQIGLDMFNTRINQDMKLLGGLEEQDLAPHRERLKAGFD